MTEQGMPPGLAHWGAVTRDSGFELPDRHLGLVQAEEVGDLEQRLDALAAGLQATKLTQLPPAVGFAAATESPGCEGESRAVENLSGTRIGIARDRAFSFLYYANLDVLSAMGAELVFFSPLADAALPEVDSVYLPGGYPELHLSQLGANLAMAAALREHVDAGKPLYAECGGMLYLLESLTDVKGQSADLTGILPGNATMQPRLKGLGYQSAALPGGVLRGHTFHHSTMQTSLMPWARGERLYNTSPGEAIYKRGSIVASYLHTYFPSNPRAAAELFLRRA